MSGSEEEEDERIQPSELPMTIIRENKAVLQIAQMSCSYGLIIEQLNFALQETSLQQTTHTEKPPRQTNKHCDTTAIPPSAKQPITYRV